MGWLWNNPQPNNMEEFLKTQANEEGGGQTPSPPENEGSRVQGNQAPQKPMKYSGFDSDAFERAAKAMKDLDQSKNAKEAIDIALKSEESRKAEAQTRMKEMEYAILQEETQRQRITEEEKRKTMREQQKFVQQNEQYKDRLTRKRHDDQLQQDRANNEAILKRQEDSTRQQEQMRRDTAEYQEKIRHENEMKRLEAKAAARGRIERDNHDLNKEKIKLESQEFRTTILEALSSAGNMIGAGINSVIENQDRILKVGMTVFCVAAGLYGAKYGAMTGARYVDRRIGKPTLVRDTSRVNYKDVWKYPITTLARLFTTRPNALEGVITHPSLEDRLKVLVASTYFTKQNKGTFRNLLMYGPPGTGKTLFAKRLAMSSGMDYAIITGGDIAPMGKEGVTAIHKVFDWGNTSRKGLILFVDEADAFLRKRTETQMSEDMRSTLNAFLYRTGESSKNVMLMMASNRPDHLDWAITDRMDEMVQFGLPALEEREKLFHLYYKQYIADLIDNGSIEWEEFDVDQTLTEAAEKSEGFSGRQISKLGIALQASVYASPDKIFRREMLFERLTESIASNRQKDVWKKEEGIEGLI